MNTPIRIHPCRFTPWMADLISCEILMCFCFVLSACWLSLDFARANDTIEPPVAMIAADTTLIHGDTLIDPYAWMRHKKDYRMINYIAAENGYTRRMTRHQEWFREKLLEEIKGRIIPVDRSVPIKKDSYYYYTRYEKDKDYAIYCRKKDSLTAAEEVLIDENILAEGNPFINIVGYRVSPGHQMLAYAVDYTGGRRLTLYFKDLKSDSILEAYIHNVGTMVWQNDTTILYTSLDSAVRAHRIFSHRLGQSKDSLLFEEPDTTLEISLSKSKSGKQILIDVRHSLSNEVHILSTDDPEQKIERIIPRQQDRLVFVDEFNDTLYIRTNYPNKQYSLHLTPRLAPEVENWTTLVAAQPDAQLEAFEIFKDYLVVTLRENGLLRFKVIDRKTGAGHYINFQEPSYAVSGFGNETYDTDKFLFSYASMLTPPIVYEYDMDGRTHKILKQTKVLGGYDKDNYITERRYALANDSVRIPVTLVYRKGMPKNGKNPVLLSGYGAYGSPADAYFLSQRISLLERGFIIAEAHVRGGGDLGYRWYEAGKMFRKQNTFDDFIRVAEHLISEQYTDPDHLIIEGGSAGGLLIGAVINQRPELFKAAILNVPFVDVINTMLDASLPLTTFEYDEWGNPNIDSCYRYMKTYSPYDNVKARDYPALLIQGGYYDSQVGVWEPVKFAAKLRSLKTDQNPLLVNISMDGGHGMVSGRYNYYKQIAFDYAFMLDQLDMEADYRTIGGLVKDIHGNPMPFVNIVVEGTSKGTSTNENGEFSMDLKHGTYNLVFQFIGYNTHVQTIETQQLTTPVTVILESEHIVLRQVTVSSKYDDPGYWIIKNAIDRRKYHLDQVDGFSCKIYIKGVDRLTEIPKSFPPFIPKAYLPDSNDLGLMYLSESVSEFHYQKPDHTKENMLASKVSGIKDGYSWNRATDIQLNFYENLIKVDYLTDRGLVSPIADNALFFYKYEYMGTLQEQGREINKIKVTPKRKADPVFEGYVYIQEGQWNLAKADLFLTGKQVEYYDTLHVRQDYIPVNDSIWMPLSLNFFAHVSIFGFAGTESYINFYEGYAVNPAFPKKFFNNELFRIEEAANKKNNFYWKETRPILLTDEEIADYAKNDSLMALKETKAYKDSVDRKYNKVNPTDLLLYGYSNYSSWHNRQFATNALIETVQFNTVEGLNFSGEFEYYRWYKEKHKSLTVQNTLRYGLDNKHFNGMIKARLNNNPKRFSIISISGGRYVFQFNDQQPISPLLNSIYTLMAEQNFMKIYEKGFVRIDHQREVFNGLMLNAGIRYEDRMPLQNVSDFVLNDRNTRTYSTNDPRDPLNQQPAFDRHQALILESSLKIRFRQTYSMRPKWKIIEGSKYPALTLGYKKGLPGLIHSAVNFDLLTLSIGDDVAAGLLGDTKFDVKAGMFLNNNALPFMDYQHFNGNRTAYLYQDDGYSFFDQSGAPLNRFQLLDYYSHSSRDYFIEGHWEHHFRGFIFNKFPFIRKAKLHTVGTLNVLHTSNHDPYVELGIGVENIVKLFRADFFSAFDASGHKLSAGIRLGYLMDL